MDGQTRAHGVFVLYAFWKQVFRNEPVKLNNKPYNSFIRVTVSDLPQRCTNCWRYTGLTFSKNTGDNVVVNAKGVGSPDECINCLGYVAFSENPWCLTNIEGGWGSDHPINCLGYVAFSKKHVGYDGSGALVTVSAA